MNKIALIGLTALLYGCSFSKEPTSEVTFNGVKPKHFYVIGVNTNAKEKSVINAYDLDGDFKPDEYIKVFGLSYNITHIMNSLHELPKDSFEHVYDENFEGRTIIKTENSRYMKPGEKESLVSVLNIIN